MIKITRNPTAFEHLTAADLAADQWLEVIDSPAPSVKKKRTRKPAAKKPKPPPPKPATVESGGDLFADEEPTPAPKPPPTEPEGTVD
jgi:hypothetical protein